MTSPPKQPYSHDAKVYVIKGDDKFATFRQAVADSRFVKHVIDTWKASGKSKDEFRIAIKPNIMTASVYEVDSPVYTDPALVEDLIRILREEGFSQFSVVESHNVYDYSYTGRHVTAVAEMCGYTGQGYTIADLTEDQVPFDYGGVLGQHPAGRVWLEADYRISFAKNKTHWQCYYTACIKNVYGCLPLADKMRHYHGKDIEFFQAAVLIAEALPVQFGFMDAWTSGDGFAGHVRDPKPNKTHTIFASENIYALDIVAGWKMNIDPSKNFVITEARQRWGEITPTVVGDDTPWPDWRNVRPISVSFFNWFEEFYWLTRLSSRAFASSQDPRFPPVKRGQGVFGILQRLSGVLARFG